MTEATPTKRWRWKWPIYWLLAIAGTFVGSGWYGQSSTLNTDVRDLLLTAERNPSDLLVFGGNGYEHRISDFRGRYVLLDFWASWCPYCRLSMPAYEALQKRYPERLEVLAINTLEPIEDARAFLEQEGIELRLLRSPQLVERFKVQVLPTTVLLDPNGRRVWATVGYVPLVTTHLLEEHLR